MSGIPWPLLLGGALLLLLGLGAIVSLTYETILDRRARHWDRTFGPQPRVVEEQPHAPVAATLRVWVSGTGGAQGNVVRIPRQRPSPPPPPATVDPVVTSELRRKIRL